MDNFDLKKYLAEGKLLKEELTPLQQYVYDYEKEVSGEDNAKEFLDGIKKLNTPNDVYDYYAFERNWEGDSDLEGDLENIYNQVLDKFKSKNENKMDNFDLKKYLAEGYLLKENDEPFESKKYVKIDNSEYYVDENGNVKLSLNFPYKFNRSHKYNAPREEYIDKNNWKEKVNPNFPIMKVINNVPTADYEFIEYPGGDKELLVKTNIEDLKKYEDGNYTLK